MHESTFPGVHCCGSLRLFRETNDQSLILRYTLPSSTMSFQCYGIVTKWFKVFKNGPSKICGRQLLKNFLHDGSIFFESKNWGCKRKIFKYLVVKQIT